MSTEYDFVDPITLAPNINVPRDILHQLQKCEVPGYASGSQALGAWGIVKMVGSEEADFDGKGWLKLVITGGKQFNGDVKVALQNNGKYTIIFHTLNNSAGAVMASNKLTDIAPADITAKIDLYVEGPITP